jgi:anti-anti-sigma factor
VVGDLDLATVRLLEEPVSRLLAEKHIARLVLDLRGATLVDSTGLRLLLELHGDARRRRWRLTVVRGPEAVQRTMTIAGLYPLIEMVDDPAQALEQDPATD